MCTSALLEPDSYQLCRSCTAIAFNELNKRNDVLFFPFAYLCCRYPALLLVGGGIGITPIMSILKDIYDYGLPISQHNEMRHAITTVYFVWVIPTVVEYDLFRKEVEEIMEIAKSPGRPRLVATVYVSRSKEDDTLTFPLICGRPKIQATFDNVMSNHPNQPALVFACGPSPLISELWDNSIRCTMQGRLIDFHHEVFEF